ncbi:MAG TPA: polysaccharide deacetylase family protein, partial [Thermoanaerobaculia bacterium]|nr:polysaccharide deacetylase family protein [Thermoanaerobaculia bacterium]
PPSSNRRAEARRSTRAVAFTFDDIPGVQHGRDRCDLAPLNRKLVAAIRRNRLPALGLVVESRACQPQLASLYKIWLDAGLELGNHTASHRDLNVTPLDEFQEDTIAGEATLVKLGKRPRYFRYPFLRSGTELTKKRAFEDFLRERGYTNAPVTIDNDEYIYAEAYARAADAATKRRLATDYIRYMESVFAFYEKFSRDTLGYEPPQVLLLHDNQINADTLDALVTMVRRRGYRAVSIAEALRDPAYARRDAYVGRRGLSWIHRWALDAGKPAPMQPGVPEWVMELYRARSNS